MAIRMAHFKVPQKIETGLVGEQEAQPGSVEISLEQKFERLVKWWREENRFTSSMTKLIMHHAYQQIIGMGPAAVPLIFREMQREPDHWFWALTAITGDNPVRPEDVGDVEKMTQAWLEWGRQHGYV
jgi:hypothetical protein